MYHEDAISTSYDFRDYVLQELYQNVLCILHYIL